MTSRTRRTVNAAFRDGIRIGEKKIRLSTASGNTGETAVLVRWISAGPGSVGIDAEGRTYYNRQGRGWRRGPLHNHHRILFGLDPIGELSTLPLAMRGV